MKIIIPMAGIGKRMRPHTLSTPKPLLKIAGKSIVERIVIDLSSNSGKKVDEVHYIIGNFGKDVVCSLMNIANEIGAQGFIHYQKEALGTAHAIFCAEDALEGDVLIAFADTMFLGNFEIEEEDEAIIWTMKVKNPEQYGVVLADKRKIVTEFIEKPNKFISDKAIIGIYYFKEGKKLRENIRKLLSDNIKTSNEFQLTDVLRNLKNLGMVFKCKTIDDWLDCGNKEEFLTSNKKLLDFNGSATLQLNYPNCKFIEPVYLGKNILLKNCTIGPYVSIENNCSIKNSSIKESIIGENNEIENSSFFLSMIGNNNRIIGCNGKLNFGDYNSYENL